MSAEGGIRGEKIRLVSMDDKFDPKRRPGHPTAVQRRASYQREAEHAIEHLSQIG